MKSADRALDILEAVAESGGRAGFSQLMIGLGIPRSSLFHLLGNLVGRGYLAQDEATAAYRLGPKLDDLLRQRPSLPLLDAVRPILRRLSAATEETAGFYVREGDHVIAIATQAGGQALSYTMRVGEKAPLYALSSGKIQLSEMRDQEIKAYLARTPLTPVTPHTITSQSKLWEEIRKVRREGFGYAREEFTIGITGIATAVRRGDVLIGSVNLAVPTARFTKQNAVRFRQQLSEAATEITTALGG